MTQQVAATPEGMSARTTALLVAASVAVLVLLVVPVVLLLWFADAFAAGATCSVGFQPFCTPGYGMPQLYAVLLTTLAAVAALVAGIVSAVRGRRRPALLLAGAAVVLALLALAAVSSELWAGAVAPRDWFIA